MTRDKISAPDETAYRNLKRLFLLRNAEISAIVLGLVIAVAFFDIKLPLRPLLIILALIIALNVYTWTRFRTGQQIHDREIFAQMLLDVAGLTGIFIYTGGASNPFVWFYLLPLMIAATILPRRHTWLMAVITVLCYTLLFFTNGSMETGQHAHHATGFQVHIFGMWMGFVMSAGFVAVIIVGMANSLHERDHRLAEAREQSLKDERLIALGTLATGTAHELGTPLGTMAILTAELEQEYTDSDNPELRRKLGILSGQITRCKEALSVLSASAGAERAESGHRMAVRRYLESVIQTWRAQRPDAAIGVQLDAAAPDCELIAERTLTQALVNVLNNAAEASPDEITLGGTWTTTELTLTVSDCGPGLSDEIHDQLGKRPVSTKREGLGIGLYLAHATIERLGGKLTIHNRDTSGTVLTIVLPLLKQQD